MPDPMTTGVTIGAVVSVAAKQDQDFISAVSGHPGESIGSILGSIAKRRLDNAEEVVARAHLTLLNIGVTEQPVPLPVLIPALEGASLQEEPSMQKVWANLLANAADPRKVTPVAATFPAILRELSGQDVRFLDAIDANHREMRKKSSFFRLLKRNWNRFHEANNFDDDSDSDTSFEYSFSLLRRHNLLTESISPRNTMERRFDEVKNPNPEVEIVLDTDYRLSYLAHYFIEACKEPSPSRDSADNAQRSASRNPD